MNQIALAVLAVSIAAVRAFAAESIPVVEYDRYSKNKSGLRESDICLSCRFDLKNRPALQAFREWNPTRLEWSYVMDPGFIKPVQDAGVPFVGTVNTNQFHGPNSDALTFDGKTAIAPWMQYFNQGKGVPYTCVNRPDTLPRRIELLKRYSEMGIRTIQHDDQAYNLSTYFWGGGCFCGECIAGFARFLKTYGSEELRAAVGAATWEGFSYKDYLSSRYGWKTVEQLKQGRAKDPLDEYFRLFCIFSTRDYFRQLVESAAAFSDKPLRLAFNTTTLPEHLYNDFILDLPDYHVGETTVCEPDTLKRIIHTLKIADALHIPQVLSPRPPGEVDVRQVRQAIALSYAMGHRMLVPWDVWLMDKTERWYGSVEEYGDLFSLVRGSAEYLDGCRPLSQVVIALPLSQQWNRLLENHRLAARIDCALSQSGIGCRYAVFGKTGRIVHIPVDPADFAGASAVITLGESDLEAGDAEELARCIAASGCPVFEANRSSRLPELELTKAVSRAVSPAARCDNRNIKVFPRAKPGDKSSALVLHLINTSAKETLGSVWVSNELLKSRSRVRATLLQPGRPPQPVTLERSGDGLRLLSLSIDVWGILVLR